MARKTGKTTKATEATEATEATTEEKAEATEPTFDLTEFEKAIDHAAAESDEATGTIPEAVIDEARAAYQALDSIKAKNAAKEMLQERMREAVRASNLRLIRAYMSLQEKAAVAAKSAPARKQVDPTKVYAQQRAVLTLAYQLQALNVPEGVDVDKAEAEASRLASEGLAAYQEDAETDHPIASRARKASVVRVGGGGRRGASSGIRRDLGAHIASAFAEVESGTFLTVAEIRKHRSEEYGDDTPSAGAISNRLQPTSGKPTTVQGITVEEREINGRTVLGAVKN